MTLEEFADTKASAQAKKQRRGVYKAPVLAGQARRPLGQMNGGGGGGGGVARRLPAPLPATNGNLAEEAKYYQVMLTKISNKKHKSWEDGILILGPKYATLKNMEGESVRGLASTGDTPLTLCVCVCVCVSGKQLARQPTKYRSLDENESLCVGRYDTEVQLDMVMCLRRPVVMMVALPLVHTGDIKHSS